MTDLNTNWKSKLFDMLDIMKKDITELEKAYAVQAVWIKIMLGIITFICLGVGGFVIKGVLDASFNQNSQKQVPIHKTVDPGNP